MPDRKCCTVFDAAVRRVQNKASKTRKLLDSLGVGPRRTVTTILRRTVIKWKRAGETSSG